MMTQAQIPSPQTIELEIRELWLLLSQFGPAFVLGVQNPYQGWLTEEIEAAHRKAAISLLERGLAQFLTDETLDVDDDLMVMAKAITHPEDTIILQCSKEDSGRQHYFHCANDTVVERVEVAADKHLVSILPSRNSLAARVLSEVDLPAAPGCRGEAFQMLEGALFQAAEAAAKGELLRMEEALQESGIGDSLASALKAALTATVFNGSIVVIANQNDAETQHVRGFGILAGAEDIWLMVPVDGQSQPYIELRPTTAQTVRQKITEILP